MGDKTLETSDSKKALKKETRKAEKAAKKAEHKGTSEQHQSTNTQEGKTTIQFFLIRKWIIDTQVINVKKNHFLH